jgi:hypothetical protein
MKNKSLKYRLTKRQRWIVKELIRGHVINEKRMSDLDLDQLGSRLAENTAYENYAPSKQALQFSIRYLIRKGMVVKLDTESRRGRARRVLIASADGFMSCIPKTVPQAELDELDENEIIMEGFDENEEFPLNADF